VFINRMKNGRDASGAGDTVAIRVAAHNKQLMMIAADDGPGMSSQVLPHAVVNCRFAMGLLVAWT